MKTAASNASVPLFLNYRQARFHNPGSDAPDVTTADNAAFTGSAALRDTVHAFVARMVGGLPDEYALSLGRHEEVCDDESDSSMLSVRAYDCDGSYFHLVMFGRAVDGEICATTTSRFAELDGPAARVAKSVAEMFGVHRNQVTISAVEEAFGLGRVEWSVNQ